MLGRTPLEWAGESNRERWWQSVSAMDRLLLSIEEMEKDLFVYSGLLFVRQIKVPRGIFICATNKIIQVHK